MKAEMWFISKRNWNMKAGYSLWQHINAIIAKGRKLRMVIIRYLFLFFFVKLIIFFHFNNSFCFLHPLLTVPDLQTCYVLTLHRKFYSHPRCIWNVIGGLSLKKTIMVVLNARLPPYLKIIQEMFINGYIWLLTISTLAIRPLNLVNLQ